MRSIVPWRRPLALLTAIVLLGGCVTTRTTSRTPSAERDKGGIQVTVYEDDDTRREGRVGPRFVAGELERRAGKGWEPVFKALSPRWTVVSLPPGKYRVRFTAQLDESGHAVRLDDPGKVVRVKKGKVTEVETVLAHVPTGLIVAGVITAVVAAVLLHEWLDDHDLPLPPLPPLDHVAEAVFQITLDATYLASEVRSAPALPPLMTSHFPENDALVAAKRVRVVFASSEPLNPGDVEAQGITVLAEGAGLLAGTTSYDPEHWWLVWEPAGNLPRGDLLHVTLAADAAEDLAGNELPAPISFQFRTAP
ncbi:MAG TPA: Ig-like domain-containing protein [Thermoanaerobaculia bacterium]|nr:Ig-like domain-containing protein [Thermoanaerobaculia bacterium]